MRSSLQREERLTSCFRFAFKQVFGYMAFVTASLLIVLRVYVSAVLFYVSQSSVIKRLWTTSSIAIWNKNRVVVAIALGVWVTNIAFLIRGESEHLSAPPSCKPGISYKRLESGTALVND
jgi:hypothetical protein